MYARPLVLALSLVVGGSAEAGSAEDFLQQARVLYDKGDLKGAVIESKNALQENPSLADARFFLGQVYLETGDGYSAEKELMRAKTLGMEGLELELDLAQAYLLQRRFKKVLELLPPGTRGSTEQQSRLMTLRGLAQMGLQETDQAAESFKLAAKLDPNAARPVLGLAQIDLQKKDPEAALMRIDGLLERDPENRRALLLKAELAKKAGRLEEALQSYQRLLKSDPDAPEALLGRASIYLARGKLEEAEQDLERSDKRAPNAVMALYLRGLLDYRRGQFDAASEKLLKVLGTVPGHVPSQLLFGVVSFSKGDYEFADEYLGRVYGSFPGNLAIGKLLGATRIKNKDPKKAIQVLEPLLAKDEKDVQLLALLGSAYMQSGDNARGAELMQRAVELNPDRAALRTQLALGLLAEGETVAAVDQLKSAVDLGQELIQADVLLVMALLKKGQFEEAMKVSQALEGRMPDSPISYNLTGLAYLAQGQYAEAAKRFEKALEVDPEFVVAETNLAKIDLRNKDLDAAQSRYLNVLKRQPNNLAALLGLAAIDEQRGDAEALQRRIEEAREKNPQAVQPGVLLTRFYLQRKEPQKALAAANDLAARFPDSPVALEYVGRAQAEAGEINSAARSFQRLVELRPTERNYLLLGGAQSLAKNLDKARQAYRKALELNPDSIPAQVALARLELQSGDQNAALLVAQNLTKAHPELAAGYQLEAEARSALGDSAKAVEAYERAYKIAKNAGLAQRMAALYRSMERTDDGLAILRDWLGEQPDDLGTRMVLAMMLQDAGRGQEALGEYEIIRKVAKNNAVVLNNLAWIYFQEGDGRALETAEQAYSADPGRPEVADTYGWILYHDGKDPQRALEILQEAYVSLPTSGEVGYHVAVVLHGLGRDPEAARTLRRVLDTNQQFAEAEAAKVLLRSIGNSATP